MDLNKLKEFINTLSKEDKDKLLATEKILKTLKKQLKIIKN